MIASLNKIRLHAFHKYHLSVLSLFLIVPVLLKNSGSLNQSGNNVPSNIILTGIESIYRAQSIHPVLDTAGYAVACPICGLQALLQLWPF